MALTLGMITVDTTDPIPLAHWWAEQTGGNVLTENEGWYVVVGLPSGMRLSFQKVDDPTEGKNRIHLDLSAPDPAAEVEHLLAAGAAKVADREMPGFAWTVLADPDGNQFCVAPAE
ncbi:VOC family protein [Gordonia sp. NPDC003429]